MSNSYNTETAQGICSCLGLFRDIKYTVYYFLSAAAAVFTFTTSTVKISVELPGMF